MSITLYSRKKILLFLVFLLQAGVSLIFGSDSDLEELKSKASAGDVGSQYKLAYKYHLTGPPDGYSEAFNWFKKAAAKGHVESQMYVGTYYLLGQGTQKDLEEAKVWLTKAADKGNIRSIYWLGHLESLKNNREEAFTFYQKAASKGDYTSMIIVADHYKLGKIVKKDLNKALSLYESALKMEPNEIYKKIILKSIDEIKLMHKKRDEEK